MTLKEFLDMFKDFDLDSEVTFAVADDYVDPEDIVLSYVQKNLKQRQYTSELMIKFDK